MPSTAKELPTKQATSVKVSTEQDAPIEAPVSVPKGPAPETPLQATQVTSIHQRSNIDISAVKIPNVSLKKTDSGSTSPDSQQTAVNNTPTSVPKPISPAQRTNSSFGLSRTLTNGVSSLGGHKLWEPKHNHEEGETQWGVNWYMPSHMAFLGIAGAAGAIGHHFYNAKLHGHIVRNSDWTQRWGLAIAFFIKFCLIGAVQIAYKQTVWLTLKQKLLKVKTIDSLFAACQEPLEFLNPEFLLKAVIPALLAGLVWLLPLCAIASPASLTSIAQILNSSTICDNIPTLNFTRELALTFTSWEEGMCFWDYTDNGTEYYNSPSDRLTKIFTVELLAGKGTLQPLNPCTGYNCTYTITFNGPAYQCVNETDFDLPSNNSVTKDLLVPTGNYSYLALSSILEDDVGRPLSWLNESQSEIGTLVEPDFWVGYVVNTTIPLAEPIVTPWGAVWAHEMTQQVLKCSMYTADKTYTLSWRDGVMTIDNWTKDNFNLMTSWTPEETDIYRILTGYHAQGFLFRHQLSGTMFNGGDDGYVTTTSGVSQTDLLGPYYLPPPDFGAAIEYEFDKAVLSIASDPVMQVYTTINTTCLASRTELIWNYRPLWLVLSYSLAVAGMLSAVVMGVLAYKWNGYGTDLGFSTILVTTRNKQLDQVVEGSCLGNTPLPEHVTQERLRFGELKNARANEVEGQAKHTGFGFAWQAGSITKGEKYS